MQPTTGLTLLPLASVEQHPRVARQRSVLLRAKIGSAMPKHSVGFGYFSHKQAPLLESKNPGYVSKTECQHPLVPLPQLAGSYACGTVVLATVLNAMQPQQPHTTSDVLDARIRLWKNHGLAPQLMLAEARRRGLYAQAYNHGSAQDLEAHLAASHVVVVLHRARTQYHYELIQAVGKNAHGETLLTLTDALENPEVQANMAKGFKTVDFEAFNKTCWQTLKLGFLEKGQADEDRQIRNTYLNIPTGHDCYYLVFSTRDDLAKPRKGQQGPWVDTPAAWLNNCANKLAKGFNGVMKQLGLKSLRTQWFGAAAA